MEYLCSALKRVRFCSTSRRRECFSEAMISKINTPFGSWLYRWICPRLKDCPKNEELAKKQSFEGGYL